MTYFVVGAGFTGATIAERIATVLGEEVRVFEKRPYVGGSAHDYRTEDGLLIQKYGPHIFHTNADRIWNYVQRFGEWRPIQYRVAASVCGELIPLPLGLPTLGSMVRLGELSREQAASFRADLWRNYPNARLGLRELRREYPEIGEWALEHVYRGYNEKQWGMPIEEVPVGILERLPFVVGEQKSYFTDKYQAVPVNGYTALIERMLDHPKITVELNTAPLLFRVQSDTVIWTGSPDDFFGEAGALPYRSVRFDHAETSEQKIAWHGEYATVTFPDKDVGGLTRVTSMWHLGPPSGPRRHVVRDYPGAYVPEKNDPFYPVPLPANVLLAQGYDARRTHNVHFAGRLGSYQYLNMDQAIAQALALFERIS